MSEPRKNHLIIDGAQQKEEEHADSYKPIPDADHEFRTSKSSLGKSKEKVSADPAEEKLLKKEAEIKITPMSTEAKYDHRNGDTKIELDAAKKQFSGLTKEELLKYEHDPFWVRLRWFMFVLFWGLWLCMLAGAIAIIIRAPKCAPPPPKTWFEVGPLVDFASAGSLDIPAVDYDVLEAKLSSLESDKIKGVFINPCEHTYEVLDEKTCVDRFKEFLKKATEKGIKLIVDLTANFVPTSHAWFQRSENKSEEYADYFVWGVGKDYTDDTKNLPNRPNNWTSLYNVPAWSWSDTRKEYYLHQYSADTADLNFHNEAVVKRFDDVLRIWMDAGAAGVRLVKARQMLASKSLSDDPPVRSQGPLPGAVNRYSFYEHKMTSDQPELDNLLAHWAHLVTSTGENVFTIHEDSTIMPEWYKHHNASVLHPPSVAPLTLGANISLFAAQLEEATKNWTAVQMTAEDDDNKKALATMAVLLRATPVLTEAQLSESNNDTETSEKYGRLVGLRNEPSIKYGDQYIVAVRDNNSTAVLLAAARLKHGQPGYLVVFNPEPEAAHANVTGIPLLPPALSIYHVSHEVRQATNYSSHGQVSSDDVLVPANSAIVFSYVPLVPNN